LAKTTKTAATGKPAAAAKTTASPAAAKAPAKSEAATKTTKPATPAKAGKAPAKPAPAKAPKPAAKTPAAAPKPAAAKAPKAAPAAKAKAPAAAKAPAPAKASAPARAAAPAKAPAKAAGAGKKAAPKPAAASTAKPAATPKPAASPAPAKAATSPAPKAARPAAAKAPAVKASAAKAPAAKPAARAKPAAAPKAAAKAKASAVAYADKPWLASYPKGIAAAISDIADKSIGDMLVSSCKKYADRPAFTCMDKTLSFAEMEEASRHFAAWLQSLGMKPEARIALMMPNVLQYPVAMMGALRAGFIVVNVNPLYTPRELEHQLKDSGAEAIVILENFAHTLQAVIGRTKVKHVVVASMGEMLGALKGAIVNLVVRRVKKLVPSWSLPGHVRFKAALAAGRGKTFRPADVNHSDVAFLQYTGGTTGVAKGAVLTHGNVLSNVAQNAIWVETAFLERKRPERLVYICALPLYHIYALTVNALMGMQQGAQNILIPNPRDLPAMVAELKKHPFNVFPGLNTLFNALLNNEDFRKLDFSRLALTFGGGMAVQKPVADRWKELTGCVIAEGYGLSETSPVATANLFGSGEFTGTIGLPIPSTEIAIRDDDGKDVPLGEVGEICIRGPQVMQGYWHRPEETAKVFTRDGFFKSGDMGFMNERGFIKIVDRKKDMILVSGFNVYPNEIEEVVAQHPGVLEVAAIGVPDEHSGEVPKLFIVKKDPNLTSEQILDYCKQNLTGYKRPRHIEFRTELPKTNVGKILRRELR